MERGKIYIMFLAFLIFISLSYITIMSPFPSVIFPEIKALLGQEFSQFLYTQRGIDMVIVVIAIFNVVACCVAMLRD